jgi:alpha-beta hydrolase superfamily lysophospholipase
VDYPAAEDTECDGDLSVSQAALRQFTFHRLLAYGVEAGDALRLFALAERGQSWRRSAIALAQQLLDKITDEDFPVTPRAEVRLRLRASALQRISQVMELDNSAARAKIYAAASSNFARARRLDKRYEHVVIQTCNGPMAAWVITPPGPGPFPVVLVHGGVDGWSMDWEGLALAVVEENMTAVLLDGPGQGESRFTHKTYLTPNWLDGYQQVCSFLVRRAAGMPVAAIGNSLAAGMVLLIASRYQVFSAVCSNGPLLSIASHLARPTYARKLAAFCGDAPSPEQVAATFMSMDLTEEAVSLTCPFLLLQGSEDPMVPVSHGEELMRCVPAEDKRMVLFEGGEHVLNRYPADKHHVITTWLRHRTSAATAFR